MSARDGGQASVKRVEEIVILGGGIGGLVAAFFLGAEKGARVTLVEREPRHDEHSSGRSAEILRTAIDDPVTEALGLRTAALLRAPSEIGLECCGPLVDDRGLIVLTGSGEEPRIDAPWIQRHVDGGAARAMAPEELREAAPHFSPVGHQAWWLPGGGHIEVERLMASLARGAMARGVRFLRSTGDARPQLEGGRILGVEFRETLLPCDSLVVAAGAWSGPIGRQIGAPLPLRTTRRHMWVTGAGASANPNAPIVWDDLAGFYARPERSTNATGWAFSTTDLEHFELRGGDAPFARAEMYAVEEAERVAALAAARTRLPLSSGDLVRSWRGFRDLTPDDRPVLGPDGRVPGLHWCAGLGGHGMTVSLAAGQVVADSIMGRAHPLSTSCSPGRFEEPGRQPAGR
ncbi:D-amino acid dehydrogenase small subunit [Planctomycetes bacterium Poly30]|uniref:D-amino acid dehydrogenase small subunit n=1 Tax=Saltatorellus ferox TaxID=2528018 RepID=A0A518EVK4_9BACT|nr:D-amino acid dehydrogenase small subunit [Planctomycetes bacterium Poly30]